MREDMFWQAFEDTGDPMCWLVYKAAERSENKDGAGENAPVSG